VNWAQNKSFGEKWAATSKRLKNTALDDIEHRFLKKVVPTARHAVKVGDSIGGFRIKTEIARIEASNALTTCYIPLVEEMRVFPQKACSR